MNWIYHIVGYTDKKKIPLGIGPHGSLIAFDGFYYEDKITILGEWSNAMNCEEIELVYETPYDGIKGFECYERKCSQGNVIIRCTGEYGHNYPLWNQEHHEAAAEIS